MELINNTTKTLKDDLSVEIKQGSKLSIAAACFSTIGLQKAEMNEYEIERGDSFTGEQTRTQTLTHAEASQIEYDLTRDC